MNGVKNFEINTMKNRPKDIFDNFLLPQQLQAIERVDFNLNNNFEKSDLNWLNCKRVKAHTTFIQIIIKSTNKFNQIVFDKYDFYSFLYITPKTFPQKSVVLWIRNVHTNKLVLIIVALIHAHLKRVKRIKNVLLNIIAQYASTLVSL